MMTIFKLMFKTSVNRTSVPADPKYCINVEFCCHMSLLWPGKQRYNSLTGTIRTVKSQRGIQITSCYPV